MNIKTERALVDAFADRWTAIHAANEAMDYAGVRAACRDIEVMRATLDLLGVEWGCIEGRGNAIAEKRFGIVEVA